MERLKRLRAAQLDKTFQKDVLSSTQRKAAEERDRAARLQIERAALERRRSPVPPRLSSPPRKFPTPWGARVHAPQNMRPPSAKDRPHPPLCLRSRSCAVNAF